MKNRPNPLTPRLRAAAAVLACLAFVSPLAFSQDTLESLRQREAKVKAVAEKATQATVGILSKSMMGAGSGVVISEDGLVLTAAHVVQAAGDEVEVVFPDGRRFPGISLGQNRSLDAAMVQIQSDAEQAFPFVEVGQSDNLALGHWCVAMGHPGGYDRLRTPPVRLGRVWSMNTPGMIDMLVSDCTLVGGDSGGPLFDLDGRVIGIHSSIGGRLEQNRHVPINIFKKDWDRLKNNERWGSIGLMSSGIEDPDRPMLGIQMGVDSPEGGGISVTGVFPNSPADKAGVRKGDVVIAIGGKEIAKPQDLIRIVASKKAGEELSIRLRRDGKELNVVSLLTLAQNLEFPDSFGLPSRPEKPEAPKMPKPETPDFGIDPPKSARAQFGAMMWDGDERAEVVELIPGSAAERAGIEAGDILVEIGGTPIPDTQALVDYISSKSPGDRIRVKLRRGAGELEMEVTLGAAK